VNTQGAPASHTLKKALLFASSVAPPAKMVAPRPLSEEPFTRSVPLLTNSRAASVASNPSDAVAPYPQVSSSSTQPFRTVTVVLE